MTVVDLLRKRAADAPEHPAILVAAEAGNRAVSYAELVERMDSRANAFTSKGVRPAWRVGLHASQGPDFVVAALGILAAGACVVPIPHETEGEPLAQYAVNAKLHALVREDRDFAVEAFAERREVEPAFAALDPAYLRFTSGTTSARKGVILGHAAILARLDAADRALGIQPEDRILWLLPMAHHFVVSVLLYLSRGATILLPRSALARDVLALAHGEGATLLYASPYHYNLLSKDGSDIQLESVRLAISTAEGLRVEVAHRFAERFGIGLVQALGIIEVGLPVLNRDAAGTKPGALGRPLPAYDVWLRDESGQPVEDSAPDRTGEICIRGPGLFDAYLDPWLPASELLGYDGFRTGDQGWFDAEGDLHLVGRRVNRINMAGMKFFAEEVEAVIDRHPAVQASRVEAREHAHLGEIPVARIVAEPSSEPPSKKELTRFCAEHLPRYKIPRDFAVVDALPTTATGKLSRRDAG